ncbi:MAG: hypothetical protein V3V23_06115 [Dehalococcoidales bacterium]
MLFKKKKPRRPIFGFPCTPAIKYAVKSLAGQIRVPVYPLAEHLLQIGATQIETDLEDEESKKDLENHLINEHLLPPVLDVENEHDIDAMIEAKKRRLLHQELEKVVRTLMGMVEREHIPVSLLADVTRAIIKDARYKRGSPDTYSKGGNDDHKKVF